MNKIFLVLLGVLLVSSFVSANCLEDDETCFGIPKIYFEVLYGNEGECLMYNFSQICYRQDKYYVTSYREPDWLNIRNHSEEYPRFFNGNLTDIPMHNYPRESFLYKITDYIFYEKVNKNIELYTAQLREKLYNYCVDSCIYPDSKVLEKYINYYNCRYNCAKTFQDGIPSVGIGENKGFYSDLATKFMSSEEDSSTEELREYESWS